MTATSTILNALRASGLPVEAQAFLASIAEGEGAIDFATLYSGGSLVNAADAADIQMVGVLREWTGSLTTFPTWTGATTKGGLISTAAGFCQDTHTTFNAYSAEFGVTGFIPSEQISFNWQLAQKVFGTRMGATLLQVLQAGELPMIPTYLGGTWPGGANASFPTRYAAHLAILQSPPAPPPPPPTPEPTNFTLTLPIEGAQLTDNNGKTWPIAVKLAGVALALLIAGSALLPTERVAQPIGDFSPPALSMVR